VYFTLNTLAVTFSISIIMIKGLQLELTNICTLKCSGCPRTQFIDIFPQHWINYSLDIQELLKFLDIDLKGIHMLLCGHTGDPIYHPDFHTVIKQLKKKGVILSIRTNGSYKSAEWWEKTVELLTEQDTISFSVDGLPENFTTYRENGDWKTIEVGMKVVAKSNCKSTWNYIPFNFNENNIDQAKELCKQIGLDELVVYKSSRWDAYTSHLKPSDDNIGSNHFNQSWINDTLQQVQMNPECSNGDTHFITANGYYTPCCYTSDFRSYYQTPFGENKDSYDIRSTTITQVLHDPQTVNFMNNLEKIKVCQYTCGTPCVK